MESRNCQVLTVRVTTPGTVGAAIQRQRWSKIARRTTVEKFVNQSIAIYVTLICVLKQHQTTGRHKNKIDLGFQRLT